MSIPGKIVSFSCTRTDFIQVPPFLMILALPVAPVGMLLLWCARFVTLFNHSLHESSFTRKIYGKSEISERTAETVPVAHGD